MKAKHIDYLCDPDSHEDLTLEDAIFNGEEIVSGVLRSSRGAYPIIDGIPRFVPDEGYSDNFGYQWNRWARIQFEDENAGKPMENFTKNMFKSITQFSSKKLKNKIVLDMGCGPGRFTDVAVEMGAKLIAVDYSTAIDAAKKNFTNKSADILFVQADALKLPIKNDAVDYCFTIGVLHHTPSPEAGVKEAFRVTKPDGEFAIRVYPKGGFYTYFMVKLWRAVFMALRPMLGHYPPLLYSYFFGSIGYGLGWVWRPLSYPLRAVFPTVWLPDYRWAILDTFDAIATNWQTGHDSDEIAKWLENAVFSSVCHVGGNDFVATK